MLLVLVEWHAPGHLLRRRVDLDGATEIAHGLEHPAGNLAHWAVGGERNALRAPVGVLDESLMRS